MASRRDIDVWISLRPSSARALDGFLPALAEVAGVDSASLRSWDALRAAAEVAKAAGPRPEGPAKLIPVGYATTREARHPERLAIATPADAMRLAHDFLEINGRLHAQVEASFRSELMTMQKTPAGRRHLLRARKAVTKFSKDPAENERLVAEWTALRQSVRPRLVAGADGAFDTAVHYPGNDLALVLRSRDPVSLGLVELPPNLPEGELPSTVSALLAKNAFMPISFDKEGASVESHYKRKMKEFAENARDRAGDFIRSLPDQPSFFRAKAMKMALQTSFWNGNAQAELHLIDRMPDGARKLLAALRPPRPRDGSPYSMTMIDHAFLLSGLAASGITRLNQAFALAPFLPAHFRDTTAEKLAISGVARSIVDGAPLRKALEQCAISIEARPPLAAPGYLRSLTHVRSFAPNFSVSDHAALALYFHARPQNAAFSPTAFTKHRAAAETLFGAAAQLAGFDHNPILARPAPDTTTFIKQAELLARAVDMRRLPTGGISRKARTLDRHIRRDSHRWLARTIAAIAGDSPRNNTEAPSAHLVASGILMPRGRTEKAFNEASDLVHKQMIRCEPLRASLEAQFGLENRSEAAIGPAIEPFPHLLRTPVEVAGVTLEPLRSHERLLEEGRDLNHCVGSYRHDAQAGRTMILGVSSASGRSTAEIQLVASELDADLAPTPPQLRIVQHRTHGNAPASAEHTSALAEFVATIERQEAAQNAKTEDRHGALSRWSDQARRHFDHDAAPLTPSQQERYRDLLFEQLKPFLSRPERQMTRQQWVEKAVPARLAALNPVPPLRTQQNVRSR